jgi:hypothetical protein
MSISDDKTSSCYPFGWNDIRWDGREGVIFGNIAIPWEKLMPSSPYRSCNYCEVKCHCWCLGWRIVRLWTNQKAQWLSSLSVPLAAQFSMPGRHQFLYLTCWLSLIVFKEILSYEPICRLGTASSGRDFFEAPDPFRMPSNVQLPSVLSAEACLIQCPRFTQLLKWIGPNASTLWSW